MKKRLAHLFLFTLTLLLFTAPAMGCVGRILYVGALNNVEDKVMAELLVLLINERTGTTVKVRLFDTNDQLYQAFKSNVEEERVDIIVEDTQDAATILHRASLDDPDKEFAEVKNLYEKEMNIIWLNPFGFTNAKTSGKAMSAPLVRRDVLTNFPLLPRVLNKLAGAIDNSTFTQLTDEAKSGSKAKNVAKDFLRAKKFI